MNTGFFIAMLRAEKLEQLLDMMEATRPLLHMAGKETETPNTNT